MASRCVTVKTELPAVFKKIHYFTDGCAGQYKNKNNLINLCHHEDDFGLAAEWNFFVTSHGKSACDSIGGTVKRLVTKASLQRPYNDQIPTSDAIINFCNDNIHGIKFFNVPPDDVARSETELKVRFELAEKLEMKQHNLYIVQEQSFVCCLYDNFPWIGMLHDISDEYGDYRINFMHPHGPARQFQWPLRKDPCWIPKDDILCCLETPSLTSSYSRNYCINQHDIVRISRLKPGKSGPLTMNSLKPVTKHYRHQVGYMDFIVCIHVHII